MLERPTNKLNPEELQGVIRTLTQGQIAENDRLHMHIGDGELFDNFMQTELYVQLYANFSRFTNFPLNPQSNIQFDGTWGNIRGKLFEGIAFFYLVNANSNPSLVVLSERRTGYFSSLYGNHAINKNGEREALGTMTPDGLLVDTDGNILKVLEYSLSNDTKYYLSKINGFEKAKSRFPEIYSGAEILFVTPIHQIAPKIPTRKIEMPFSKDDFENFAERVMYENPSTEPETFQAPVVN